MNRVLVFAAFLLGSGLAWAATQPVDPDLIPEGRAVLAYLESIYGKKTLAGANAMKAANSIREACGKDPAIVTFDLHGWSRPAFGEAYQKIVGQSMSDAKAWWQKGGIVTVQIHWLNPANPQGSAWMEARGKSTASPPYPFEAALTPGTPENQALMRDLDGHADWLEQLAAARVPVLWRPLHEVEGGWFWWTDKITPENTAKLWRLMFDHFVHQRKLHNLIWVYSAAVRAGKGKDAGTAVEWRRRYYPGAEYVDIAGIDIYPDAVLGFGKPQDDTYPSAFETMKLVAPGKMLALAECEAMPDPRKIAASGPRWLYALPWWPVGEHISADWVRASYIHPDIVTLDQLPRFTR